MNWQRITANVWLATDFELRFTPKGLAVGSFICYLKDGRGENAKDTKARVTVWGEQAERYNEWLKKRAKVTVDGRVTGIDIWTPDGGAPQATLEITANYIDLLDDRSTQADAASDQGGPADDLSRIPF